MVWAQRLPSLTPSERLVVLELARLADGRGVAIVSIDHLVSATGRCRRAVFDAVGGLELAGWLSREGRRRGRRCASSRFELHYGALAVEHCPEATVSEASLASMARSAAGRAIDPQDNSALRDAIRLAQIEGWQGDASACLAATILESGRRQFHTAIARGRQSGRMGREESELDTLGVAWEAVRLHGETITAAHKPWAMWTMIVVNTCKARDFALIPTPTDPFEMPEDGLLAGESKSDEPPAVGVDDFEGPLASMVDALVEAGMDETLAWAGSLRIVELAVDGDKTRRITQAAKDVRLGDLGIPSECARRWMTLLSGTRRGARASIVEMSPAELAEAALSVVEALKPAA